MTNFFLGTAKLFLYLAALSVLIVASSMFFPFIVGKAIFFRIAVEFALLAYCLFLLSPGRPEKFDEARAVVRKPLVIALLVFTLLFLLSSLTAVDPMIAFWSNFERGEGGLQMLHYGIYFCLVALVFKDKREWQAYIKWILLLGFFVSLYAWGQRYGGPDPASAFWKLVALPYHLLASVFGGSGASSGILGFFGDGKRASGTLGNPLYLSTFILFLCFFALWLIGEKKDLRTRLLLSIYILFQLATFAILAQSRNGVAGLGLGVIAALVALTFLKTDHLRIRGLPVRRVAAGLLAASILCGGIFYATRTNPVWQNVPGLKRFARERILTGIDDRLWTWGTTLEGIKEKPFFGWGPENFPIIFDKYYNANHYGSDSWFDRAHDIYLEYLISGGIVLFLGYIFIWAMFLRELWKRRRTLPPVTLALFIGFAVAYIVQGLTAFEVLPIYILLYVFLAFTLHAVQAFGEDKEKGNERLKHRAHAHAFQPIPLVNYLIIVAVGAGVVLSLYFANYLPFKKNRLLLTAAASQGNQGEAFIVFMGGKNPQTGEETPGALTYYSPIGQQETVQYFTLFVLRVLDANMKNPEFAKQSEAIRQLVQRTNEIYEENEASPFRAVGVKTLYYMALTYFRAAVALKDTALLAKAEELMRQGHTLAPTRIEFLFGLLDVAAAKNDRAMALPLLERVNRLRPDLKKQTAVYEQTLSGNATSAKQ